MKYEYEILPASEFSGFSSEMLNALGQKGFKVVGVIQFHIILMKEYKGD